MPELLKFPLQVVPAGRDLAGKFLPKSAGVWEWKVAAPLTDLPCGKLTVRVKHRQGNERRIERTFSVGAGR